MKRLVILAVALFFMSNVSAQQKDYFNVFIEKADQSVSKDLSMFKYDIRQRFAGVGYIKLNDLYSQFGSKWSNVVMALTIAQASDTSIGRVLTRYNRCKPTDWSLIASELGITENSASKQKIDVLMSDQIRAWKLENGNN